MTQPTRITFRIDAGPDERYSERFAQSLIGQTPRLTHREHEGGPVLADYGAATVVAAEIIDDGAAVLITYEAPAGAQALPALTDLIEVGLADRLPGSLPAMSFRFDEAERAEDRR